VLFEGHERHAVTAGVSDPAYVDNDDGTHADTVSPYEVRGQLGEFGGIARDRPRSSVETHDTGWPGKGAEHEDNSPILLQVSNGFDPATRLVEISDGPFAQDSEFIPIALRRTVDETVTIEGSRRHEKDRLGDQPFRQSSVNTFVRAAHPAIIASRRIEANGDVQTQGAADSSAVTAVVFDRRYVYQHNTSQEWDVRVG
jgi:hypothetical protein